MTTTTTEKILEMCDENFAMGWTMIVFFELRLDSAPIVQCSERLTLLLGVMIQVINDSEKASTELTMGVSV